MNKIGITTVIIGLIGCASLQSNSNPEVRFNPEVKVNVPNTQVLAVQVLDVRLVPVKTPTGTVQTVSVDWENIGTIPVRLVRATIAAYDASGKELYSRNQVVFSTTKEKRIPSGETYIEPWELNATLPKLGGVSRVTATLTEIQS